MISADLPRNEKERLRQLRELDILDTFEERTYDDLTLLAAQICEAPIALVCLVDENRQWFKSHHGLAVRETSRDLAFCAHAILGDGLFVIKNAELDARFHDNPLVTGKPHAKFYAGAPLVLESNIRIGTLCVIDDHARELSKTQQNSLVALARQVVSQLQLRLKIKALEDVDHIKDEFLSMVSHELRTPLTSLKGSLGIMNHLRQDLEEQMNTMLNVAVQNTDHLLIIVNDILDLAKMEAGRFEFESAPVKIVELLHKALELNESYIEQCACEVVLNIPKDAGEYTVMGDELRLIQVISNLLSNAAKFSPNGGRIELGIERDNEQVRICVTDYGAGIPDELQVHLFKKFHQLAETQNQKLPGTGLGLNICKHIIESHHGTIGFKSIPNEKTVFYFALKLSEQSCEN